MLNEEIQNQIEKYLNNEMTEAEQTAFEKQVNTDENLAKELQLYQDMAIQLTNVNANIDLNNKLKRTQNDYRASNQSSNKSLKFSLVIIVLITILGIGWWLTTSQNTTNSSSEIPIASLWNETEMPSSNIIRNADIIPEDTRLYQAAHLLFTEKKWNRVINILDSISSSSNIYPETTILKGVCEYELGNYEMAIQTYNKYLGIKNAPKDMALWYQALAYIQNQDNENAIKNLDEIIQNAYSKAAEATTLLKQL